MQYDSKTCFGLQMSTFNQSAPPPQEEALLPPAYIRAQRAATFSSPDFKSIILELQVEQNNLKRNYESSARLRNVGVFLLLFIFIMVIFSNHIEHPRAAYQFSVRWPVVDCAINSTACNLNLAKMNTWIISRFAPLTPNRPCNTYCNNQPFNESEVASIKADLAKFWPDTAKFGEESTWAHEWHKFGTCSHLDSLPFSPEHCLSIHAKSWAIGWPMMVSHQATPTRTRRSGWKRPLLLDFGQRPVSHCTVNGIEAYSFCQKYLCVSPKTDASWQPALKRWPSTPAVTSLFMRQHSDQLSFLLHFCHLPSLTPIQRPIFDLRQQGTSGCCTAL